MIESRQVSERLEGDTVGRENPNCSDLDEGVAGRYFPTFIYYPCSRDESAVGTIKLK